MESLGSVPAGTGEECIPRKLGTRAPTQLRTRAPRQLRARAPRQLRTCAPRQLRTCIQTVEDMSKCLSLSMDGETGQCSCWDR